MFFKKYNVSYITNLEKKFLKVTLIFSQHKIILYIEYQRYDEVIRQYNKYENFKDDDDADEFKEIIKNINIESNKMLLLRKIFIKLHKLIRNSHVFYGDMTEKYCSYVNYILNKEVSGRHNLVNKDNFDIFHKFVVNFNKIRFIKDQGTCYRHVQYLNEDIHKRMTILYDFYTFYNNLKSSKFSVNNDVCENLLYYIYLYNNVINDYYDSDLDLYKKISHVKDLIVRFISNKDLTCKKYAIFREATNFLRDERLKREAEQKAEELKREQAKKEALERAQAERDAALKSIQEQYIESPKENQPMKKIVEDLQEGLNQENTRMEAESENFGAPRNLRVQEQSHVLSYPVTSHNLANLADYREQSLSEPYEDQLKQTYNKPENEDTNTDGSFMKAFRLPSAITEVLGEVDPVPVVGVSEEADVDNESLIDFMENIRNFFQVFKDMEMDIFQMIDLI
ncbi:hypothetical protein PVBG_05813 [Plasmodium vivax Brazil I]|uniref:Uncharacterized protein n=1 Tax=Plasmodium vivax (strain Brazil I) TaxID=1033975 RepID=A0A0J9SYN1_PLAV1|nr:hypothetical protein PVBG_05813 [Plasmodium vivax Brazil I]